MVSVGKYVLNFSEMPTSVCSNYNCLVCYWGMFHKLGLPSQKWGRERVRQGSGPWKCFMTFSPTEVIVRKTEIIATAASTQGKFVYYGNQSTCIHSFSLESTTIWNTFLPFLTASLRKAPQLSLRKVLRSRCDWPNFINDGFKAYWDWGCLC